MKQGELFKGLSPVEPGAMARAAERLKQNFPSEEVQEFSVEAFALLGDQNKNLCSQWHACETKYSQLVNEIVEALHISKPGSMTLPEYVDGLYQTKERYKVALEWYERFAGTTAIEYDNGNVAKRALNPPPAIIEHSADCICHCCL